MSNSDHQKYNDALESRNYCSLFIRRHGKECMLIIDIDGTPHVFVNKVGKPQKYRHAWQIKEWLLEKFDIESDQVEVKDAAKS